MTTKQAEAEAPAIEAPTTEQRLQRIEQAIAELGWRSAVMNGRGGLAESSPALISIMQEVQDGEHPLTPGWFAALKARGYEFASAGGLT
jgi:hypothetical protein